MLSSGRIWYGGFMFPSAARETKLLSLLGDVMTDFYNAQIILGASPSRGAALSYFRNGGEHHLHAPHLAAGGRSAVPMLRSLSSFSTQAAAAPPEGAADAAGEAAGHLPDHATQPSVLQLGHAHVVLQVLGRHVDVAAVPEHPPDEAEEDDDGAGVDEEVVDHQAAEHTSHHDDHTQDVVGHSEPEGALAAADPTVLDLRHRLHLHLRRHGGAEGVFHPHDTT